MEVLDHTSRGNHQNLKEILKVDDLNGKHVVHSAHKSKYDALYSFLRGDQIPTRPMDRVVSENGYVAFEVDEDLHITLHCHDGKNDHFISIHFPFILG